MPINFFLQNHILHILAAYLREILYLCPKNQLNGIENVTCTGILQHMFQTVLSPPEK